VTVEAVPAYNIGKLYHPEGQQLDRFLITVEAKRIYYGGVAMSFRK